MTFVDLPVLRVLPLLLLLSACATQAPPQAASAPTTPTADARSRSSDSTRVTWSTGLDASWEADLSGELASAERGAFADTTTAAANLDATRRAAGGAAGSDRGIAARVSRGGYSGEILR